MKATSSGEIGDLSSASALPGGGQESHPKDPRRASQGGGSHDPRTGHRRSSLLRILPPVLGVLATLGVQDLVLEFVPPGRFLHRILRASGDWQERIVPTAILFLFFWCFFELLGKLIYNYRNRSHLSHRTFRGLPGLVREVGVATALARLEGLPERRRTSLVYARLHSLLDQLRAVGDPRRVHEFFRHKTQIAVENANSGFHTARLFIWAMPILGFIGTVLGIGLAVGNFSGFLTGDIDDIEAVKAQLSHVAGGLSFAFDTTLLGLTGSLVAMLLCTWAQRTEENFLTDIEELELEIIANTDGGGIAGDAEDLDAVLGSIKDLSGRFRHLTAAAGQLDGAVAEFAGVLGRAWMSVDGQGKRVIAGLDEIKVFGREAHRSFGESMAALRMSSERLAEEVSALGQRQDAAEQLVGAVSQLKDQVSVIQSTHRDTAGLLEAMSHPLQQASRALSEDLPTGLSAIQKNEETLAGSLESFGRTLEPIGPALKEAIDRLHDTARDLTEKVDSLGKRQDVAEKAMASVQDLMGCLVKLEETHGETRRLLGQLQRPFEFRLVSSPDPPQVSEGGDGGDA